jgi:hypothetical protein
MQLLPGPSDETTPGSKLGGSTPTYKRSVGVSLVGVSLIIFSDPIQERVNISKAAIAKSFFIFISLGSRALKGNQNTLQS